MSLSMHSETTATGTVEEAAKIIRSGGVVAYPTESCFGIGCDPDYIPAVQRILQMKQRERSKGVILIADRFERFQAYIKPLPEDTVQALLDSWPGPNTWLCPAQKNVSPWIKGEHNSLAIRVTGHRVAASLARQAERAIVSTSANIASEPSLLTAESVLKTFGDLIDMVVDQEIGGDKNPSTIRDAVTKEVIR